MSVSEEGVVFFLVAYPVFEQKHIRLLLAFLLCRLKSLRLALGRDVFGNVI